MIKEIKFTDKALKQINSLLSKKNEGSFLESLLKVVVVQDFNMNFPLKKIKMMMT
jgi:hypothetical protein